MNAYANTKYVFENDKLKEVNTSVTFKDITVDNIDLVWDTFKKQFNEQNYPTNELGFERKTKSDDKKHTFTVNIKIDYGKISEEIMKKYSIEDYSSKTYSELKDSILKDDDTECK